MKIIRNLLFRTFCADIPNFYYFWGLGSGKKVCLKWSNEGLRHFLPYAVAQLVHHVNTGVKKKGRILP